MSISLIAVRLVVSATSNPPMTDLNYTAPKYEEMERTSPQPPVDEKQPEEMKQGQNDVDQTKSHDVREYRQIVLESYPMSSAREMTPSGSCSSPTQREMSVVQFYTGNHFVENIEGILHLYKENRTTTLGEEAQRSEIVCMLAVSSKKSLKEILEFTMPFHSDIEKYQVIRDTKPVHYMVLIKFTSERAADEFYNAFNGSTYNELEPEVVHLAYVASIEMLEENKSNALPICGFTELPTCPVCLERMDESVQGILTILCNHSFHSQCLEQCSDSRCPVCRYCQIPETVEDDNCCCECGSHSTEQDSLWICLVCGHIGCGRYVQGHAYKHYRDTQHTYAMQLGSNNRVWDYAGDNYVHRLLANKDGDMVEGKSGNLGGVPTNNSLVSDEKIDSVQLEYTYLLTNQLENQRKYFENILQAIEKEKQEKINELMEKNRFLSEDNQTLNNILDTLKKDKIQLEKKITQISDKLVKTVASFEEEKEMNNSLRKNQEEWVKKLVESEKSRLHRDQEIKDLKEQLQDVMMFLDASQKLQNIGDVSKEEIEEASIVISPSSSSKKDATRQKKRR